MPRWPPMWVTTAGGAFAQGLSLPTPHGLLTGCQLWHLSALLDEFLVNGFPIFQHFKFFYEFTIILTDLVKGKSHVIFLSSYLTLWY